MDNEQVSLIIALWNSADNTVRNINQSDASNFLLAVKDGDTDKTVRAWSNILTNPNNDVDTDFIADMEVAIDPELHNNQKLSAKA